MGIIDKIFKKKKDKALQTTVQTVQSGAPIYNEARLFEVNAWIYAGIKRIADSMMLVDHSIAPEKVKQLFENTPYVSFRIMLRKTVGQLQVYGYTFWSLVDGTLMIVPPYSVVDAVKTKDGWKLKYMAFDGNYYYTNPKYTVKIENFNPTMHAFGLSPIFLLKKTASLAETVEDLNAEIIENGNYTQGYFKTEKQINETLYKKIRQRYTEFMLGRASIKMPLILDNGLEYVRLNILPEQLKGIDLDNITRDKVAAVLGVPASFLNAYDKLNYATAREQTKIFWNITMIPILKYIEDVINNKIIKTLFTAGSFHFVLDNIDALKEDELKKAQTYHIYLEDGIMTTNEVRERLGLEPQTPKSLSLYYKRFRKATQHAARKIEKSTNPKEIVPVLLAVAQQGADTACFDLEIEYDYSVSELYNDIKNFAGEKSVEKAFNLGYYYVASRNKARIIAINKDGTSMPVEAFNDIKDGFTVVAFHYKQEEENA